MQYLFSTIIVSKQVWPPGLHVEIGSNSYIMIQIGVDLETCFIGRIQRQLPKHLAIGTTEIP